MEGIKVCRVLFEKLLHKQKGMNGGLCRSGGTSSARVALQLRATQLARKHSFITSTSAHNRNTSPHWQSNRNQLPASSSPNMCLVFLRGDSYITTHFPSQGKVSASMISDVTLQFADGKTQTPCNCKMQHIAVVFSGPLKIDYVT